VKTQTLRHFALACLALLACALPAAPAHAQPSQIKIVVPYTPGSGPDILSRLMANEIGRAQDPHTPSFVATGCDGSFSGLYRQLSARASL
jgi:tripartite-type tricarboxylate transporter receptor subunit TctC